MPATPILRLRGAACALAFIALAALAACSRSEAPRAPAAVPVTITRATLQDVPVRLDAPGSVEAVNSVAVTAQIDGQLLESLVQDGADVEKGQLLFRIDPRPAEAALRQAEAELARARALLAEARSRVERYAPVADKGYVSADQMQQYRTAPAAAAGAVRVDEANVAAARLELGYTEIRAPIAGRLGRILVQPGNVVRANGGTPLVTINQIAPIYVGFALPGRILGRLLAAQSAAPLAVAARVPGLAAPVDGRVAFIDNAVDTATGTIRLRGEFANAGHLLWPGQLVGVSLTLGIDRAAVVLPDGAVRNGPDGTYVFIVCEDGSAAQRRVAVARVADGQAVIESGLEAGETVVLDGQSRVQDGTPLAFDRPAADGAADAAR
jgi:multidrug efflux system membrane fusion protein